MLIVQYFVCIRKKSIREEVESTSTSKRHDFKRTNQLSRKSIVLKTIDRSSVAPVRPKWRSAFTHTASFYVDTTSAGYWRCIEVETTLYEYRAGPSCMEYGASYASCRLSYSLKVNFNSKKKKKYLFFYFLKIPSHKFPCPHDQKYRPLAYGF